MSSIRRILASKANGARSTGPVTAEGKRISSRNALTHGLLSRIVVLEDESDDTFQTLVSQHLDRLQPADGMELGMVGQMVLAHWRMRRPAAIPNER